MKKLKISYYHFSGKKIRRYRYLDDEKEGYEVFRIAEELVMMLNRAGFKNIKVKFNDVIGALHFYYFEKYKLNIQLCKFFKNLFIPINKSISKLNLSFLGKDIFISATK